MRNIYITVQFFCLAVFSTLINPCLGQTNNLYSKKIAPALLRNDFILLTDTLKKIHPGIYRYKSKKEIDHIFDSCLSTIKDPMSVPDFYALTSFTIAAMQDGHSNCRVPRPVMDDFVNSSPVFPAMVLFINGHAYIFCCKQNPSLNGVELISINDRSCDKMIQKIFSYIPSDAGIKSRKNWELPETFHLLYNAIYGTQRHFDISFRSANGIFGKATLEADMIKNIFCTNPFPAPKKYLELSYYSGNIALLRIKTFFDGFLEQTGENFHTFLDSAFDDIKNKHAEKLIIDLRRNQGGNDGNGALLYSYLTQKPFAYYRSLETVHQKFTPEGHALLDMQQPQKKSFSGKLFLLMDGRSFSASSEFAAVAKSNNRAIFLGEENGGGYYGNTSGDDLTLVLPNSQISCRIPLIKYTVAVKKLPGGSLGITPDHTIYPMIGDIIAAKDSEGEEALRFAGSH